MRARFLRKSGGSVEHDEIEAALGGLPTLEGVPDWVLAWNRGSSEHAKRNVNP